MRSTSSTSSTPAPPPAPPVVAAVGAGAPPPSGSVAGCMARRAISLGSTPSRSARTVAIAGSHDAGICALTDGSSGGFARTISSSLVLSSCSVASPPCTHETQITFSCTLRGLNPSRTSVAAWWRARAAESQLACGVVASSNARAEVSLGGLGSILSQCVSTGTTTASGALAVR